MRHLQRHHNDTTRVQLAAWDRAVAAWRHAGMDERNSDGSTLTYVDAGSAGQHALGAAVEWIIQAPLGVIGTPSAISYGGTSA